MTILRRFLVVAAGLLGLLSPSWAQTINFTADTLLRVPGRSRIAFPDGVNPYLVPASGNAALLFQTASKTLAGTRALSGLSVNQAPQTIVVTDRYAGGQFYLDITDKASADNGATVLVTSSGLRYKRMNVERLNVSWWAAADGSVGDAAFTAAFAAAQAGAVKRVYLPTSTTAQVYSVTVAQGLTLELGDQSVLRGRVLTSAENDAQTTQGYETPVVELRGGTVLGRGIIDANRSGGRKWTHPNSSVSYSAGIMALYTQPVVVQSVTITNGGDGIWIQGTHDSRIEGVTMLNNTNRNINGVESNRLIVSGNYINGGLNGIQWFGGKASTANYCANWTVVNNQVYNVDNGGIWGTYGIDITIAGNSVKWCKDVGIDPERSNNISITGNVVQNCTNGCLTVFNACKKISFVGNVVRQEQGWGNGIHIWGNNIPGLTEQSSDITVQGGSVEITDSTKTGVMTEQGVSADLTIQNVTITSTKSYAIRVLQINRTVITDCPRIASLTTPVISIEGCSNGRFENDLIDYQGSVASSSAVGLLLTCSGSTPAQYNVVKNMRVMRAGINDDAWCNNASFNRFENNQAEWFSKPASGWQGTARNNTNAALAYIDNSAQAQLPINLSPQANDMLTYSGSSYTNTPRWLNSSTGGDGVKYAPILSLPASSGGSFDNAQLLVSLGAWGANLKKVFHVTVGNRDGFVINVTSQGNTGAPCSLLAYQNADNTVTLYIQVQSFSEVGVFYQRVYQSSGVSGINYLANNATPSGTKVYDSSVTPPNLEVTGSFVQANGKRVHDNSFFPVSTTLSAATAGQSLFSDGTQFTSGFPKHVTGGSVSPTISTSTGAGSSPAVSLNANSDVSTDLSGVISLTTGSSPASGLIVRVTYAGAYSRIPKVAIDGANDAAVLNRTLYRVSNRTTTGFDLINTSSNTLPASTAFLITYTVTE